MEFNHKTGDWADSGCPPADPVHQFSGFHRTCPAGSHPGLFDLSLGIAHQRYITSLALTVTLMYLMILVTLASLITGVGSPWSNKSQPH